MKYLLYIWSFLAVLSTENTQYSAIENEITAIKVLPESSLKINGKTNVNKFSCVFQISNINQPIRVNFEKKKEHLKFKNTFLILENDCFDCGNNMMNKDLRKLLKTDDFPHIQLLLKAVELKNADNISMAVVEISLAGVKNNYRVPVQIKNSNHTNLNGVLAIDIEDFDLEAPKKMLGAVKVSNYIEIQFDLNVKDIEN